MKTVIPGQHGSTLHRLAVTMVERHRETAGTCTQCGLPAPCPARSHAVTVIVACGDDPDRYDGSPAPAPVRPDPVTDVAELDNGRTVYGFSLGGVGRRADVPYFPYSRDTEP